MILEMIDGEPPYFSEPPLQAMRKLRDLDPPITQRNGEVSFQLGDLKQTTWSNKAFCNINLFYFLQYSIL